MSDVQQDSSFKEEVLYVSKGKLVRIKYNPDQDESFQRKKMKQFYGS